MYVCLALNAVEELKGQKELEGQKAPLFSHLFFFLARVGS